MSNGGVGFVARKFGGKAPPEAEMTPEQWQRFCGSADCRLPHYRGQPQSCHFSSRGRRFVDTSMHQTGCRSETPLNGVPRSGSLLRMDPFEDASIRLESARYSKQKSRTVALESPANRLTVAVIRKIGEGKRSGQTDLLW